MEEVRMKSLYLQELTFIKYKQEIIQTPARWWFWNNYCL